jgi:hypothetical protein
VHRNRRTSVSNQSLLLHCEGMRKAIAKFALKMSHQPRRCPRLDPGSYVVLLRGKLNRSYIISTQVRRRCRSSTASTPTINPAWIFWAIANDDNFVLKNGCSKFRTPGLKQKKARVI